MKKQTVVIFGLIALFIVIVSPPVSGTNGMSKLIFVSDTTSDTHMLKTPSHLPNQKAADQASPQLYCLGGVCTSSSSSNTVSPQPSTTFTSASSSSSTSSFAANPCPSTQSLQHTPNQSASLPNQKSEKHHRGGFLRGLFELLTKLLELILQTAGLNPSGLSTPSTSSPCTPIATVSSAPSSSSSSMATSSSSAAGGSPTNASPGKRDIPIAPNGGLGQFNLSSKSYIMAFRFVLDQPQTIDRWYYAINMEGTTCVGGRTGYGSGNGGTEFGRIVEVDQATGFPTNKILAQESVNGCDAQNRSMSEFGLQKTHQAHFVQFAPVSLEAGKMYAFLLSNTDPNPGNGGSKGGGNHTSPNLNFGKLSDIGPNGKNTLDANAAGAMYGYDPRETTMWSDDSGATWKFGDQVGWYQTGSGDGRMWVVGYRANGKNIPHGYTYMNWPSDSNGASITYKNVPKAVTLTHAGGATGGSVGVVTVTNTSTGVSATTPSLGGGVPVGQLSKPVPVAAGESYTIKASGSVETGSSAFWDKIFGLGSNYASSCSSCSNPADMPALFALPHPYY